MNVLILGGDGFIGSHFVDQVVDSGHNVTVFDRFPYNISRNLEHQKENIKLINGEFANREQLTKALKGQDIVFHFISSTNPASSWHDPHIEVEITLKESLHFFDLAVKNGIKKIVFTSSGGTIYGSSPGVINEDHSTKPFSPYGIAKLSIEHFLRYFHEYSGISVDIYRIGNPFGPRQPMGRPQGVIAVWMDKILANKEIIVYGDHHSLRDYIFVKDVAYLMTYSLRDIESSCFNIFNLGTGRGVSIIELLNIFKSQIDVLFQKQILPSRNFDNTSVILDSEKLLSNFLDFRFQKFEEKINETWLYVKREHKKES